MFIQNSLSPGGLTTIDNQHVSGHIRGSIRSQKYRSTLQVVMTAEAASRNFRQQRIFVVLEDPLRHVGGEPSGSDRVHLDVMRRPLAGQIFGECDDATFARVLADRLHFGRCSTQTRHRGDIDDLSGSLGSHLLARRLTKEEGASQISVENFVPLLERHIFDGSAP
jgi:hypothetical protein